MTKRRLYEPLSSSNSLAKGGLLSVEQVQARAVIEWIFNSFVDDHHHQKRGRFRRKSEMIREVLGRLVRVAPARPHEQDLLVAVLQHLEKASG